MNAHKRLIEVTGLVGGYASAEQIVKGVAMGADARLDRPDFGQQLQMRGAVLGETRRMNVDLGSENRHAASPPGAFQGAAAM